MVGEMTRLIFIGLGSPADAFSKIGAKASVYDFGDGDVRTAVSLQNLGIDPFIAQRNSVKLDRHKH